MILFLNGQLVPAEKAMISSFDRGFLYGDGLFETLRIHQGKPFRWEQHWQRLARGAGVLRLNLPYGCEEAREGVNRLLSENGITEAILRINVSRGVGVRGYSVRGAKNPTFVMSLHDPPAPPTSWKMKTSSFRIFSEDTLAQIKTSSKLTHILARAEAEDAGVHEALLLNQHGEIAEAASGNFFWIEKNTLFTPALATGALEGITRAAVLEICAARSISCRKERSKPAPLRKADAAFVTLSTWGLVEVSALDGFKFPGSSLLAELQSDYQALTKK
jgi:aminodeoxychorismate lyase